MTLQIFLSAMFTFAVCGYVIIDAVAQRSEKTWRTKQPDQHPPLGEKDQA